MANYISKYTGAQIDKAVGDVLNGNVGGTGGGGNITIDDTLTKAGAAADAKATGDRLTALSEEMANKKGLTSAQITALDNMFKVCAYTSSANSAYAAFCAAFGITGGGTGGDSDGVNVYFADYSEWYRQGSGISVIDNGFSVVSPELSYSAGIAVGMLQDGKYGDYKDKTLKISYDVAGEISSDASIPIYLRTYTDVPGSDYLENQTAFTRGPVTNQAKHVEWTINPSTAKWESGTPTDTDYMGLQFYFYFVGTATITNFTIEVV